MTDAPSLPQIRSKSDFSPVPDSRNEFVLHCSSNVLLAVKVLYKIEVYLMKFPDKFIIRYRRRNNAYYYFEYNRYTVKS